MNFLRVSRFGSCRMKKMKLNGIDLRFFTKYTGIQLSPVHRPRPVRNAFFNLMKWNKNPIARHWSFAINHRRRRRSRSMSLRTSTDVPACMICFSALWLRIKNTAYRTRDGVEIALQHCGREGNREWSEKKKKSEK